VKVRWIRAALHPDQEARIGVLLGDGSCKKTNAAHVAPTQVLSQVLIEDMHLLRPDRYGCQNRPITTTSSKL
jgi:hypothetical protein